MFGSWFYNQRIRKSVAVFGSLFDNLYVVRKDSAGATINQVKVPLAYAPRRDFIDRIAQMENGENQERQIAIKLPRMSFEILGMNYDAARQLPANNKRLNISSTGATNASGIYTPVPFDINFQLNIYARSQDDCLQCVEQILPYFTPLYNVSVKPLEDYDLVEDNPIRLDGLTFQDDYEGSIESRRTIIYTLDFLMKINIYKKSDTSGSIINQVDTSIYDMNNDGLLQFISCVANVVSGDNGTLANEDGGNITNTLKIKTTLNPITGDAFEVSTNPTNGTASVVATSGVWTYTPNPDWYGVDSFVISVDVGQNVSEFVTINITVTTPVQDVFDDMITTTTLTPTLINVSTNDVFETDGDVTYAIEDEPINGSLVITDSLNGLFTYTSNAGFVGTDTFVYRAIPENGLSEIGTVNITVGA